MPATPSKPKKSLPKSVRWEKSHCRAGRKKKKMHHTPSSSNQTEIVIVAQTPEEQANLDRFDKLDFEVWNNKNGHFTRDT
jgi:hypothetical protein